ncbi:hypothetical protein DSCW_25800 [Desulfosarcina widdelii]|uniref:DUF11 domain-containing protein n=1 Tax=Desulfosarcina widdelii TaxID=947919 RepID=A0A5K7Z5H4_9BACT|nr:hypothetical protein [Desulfosarcina widdelii]BBO75163.1 hypothetical protein DSCW_25800 [Desulfosarcina widdelii]
MRKFISIIALFFLFTLCVHIGRALADVAANSQIVSEATLTFDDGSGSQTVTASVTVTVSHVPGIPTIDSPADGTIAYAGAGTELDFTYIITANGNGPDTYTIASSVTGQTNTSGANATLASSTVDLGATVTVSGSTDSVLQVPSDGDDTDSSVNGIAVGDTVVVDGETRTVTAISDPATGTATITLSAALSAAPTAGVSILEQATVTLTVSSGTVVTTGTDIVVTAQTTASSSAGSSTADEVQATYTSGSATLTKYVRNVTDPNGTTGATSFTVNSDTNDYYTDGVTGVPGDTLEYLLLVENAGSGDVTDCAIDDVLPADFVTLVTDAYSGYAVTYVAADSTESTLSQDADADAATLSGTTLTVNVGTGASSTSGGTVAATESIFIVYQVTINN